MYDVLDQICDAVPYSVPLPLPKDTPFGRLVLFSSQEVIVPDPVIAGTSGMSP
jgi:hypothetical protein